MPRKRAEAVPKDRSGDHRNTPEDVLAPVREMGPIITDPCSNKHSIVRARIEFTERDDGLIQHWHGVTFVNAVWRNLLPWAQKGVAEVDKGCCELFFWAPCYPETAWAKTLFAREPLVCAWHKRVRHPVGGFDSAPKGEASMWPTMMVYLGNRTATFRRVFAKHGTVMQVLGGDACP